MQIPVWQGRMSLRQLRYFIAIADARTYSQAAKRLSVSQPTLTVAMQKLSRDLNATLFVPTGNGYDLTPAGSLLYSEGQRILREFEDMERRVREIGSENSESLRVGITHFICDRLLSRIRTFIYCHPNVELTLVHNGSRELQRQVSAGELELAVVSMPQHYTDVEISPMEVERNYDIGVVMSKQHPLASRDELMWSDLRDCTFSSLGSDYTVYHLLHRYAKRAGFYPNIVCLDNSEQTLISSVLECGSVCLLPMDLEDSYHDCDVCWVPLKDQGATVSIGVAVKENRFSTNSMSEFMRIIRRG